MRDIPVEFTIRKFDVFPAIDAIRFHADVVHALLHVFAMQSTTIRASDRFPVTMVLEKIQLAVCHSKFATAVDALFGDCDLFAFSLRSRSAARRVSKSAFAWHSRHKLTDSSAVENGLLHFSHRLRIVLVTSFIANAAFSAASPTLLFVFWRSLLYHGTLN